jgi:hypothetical protein
MELGHVLNIIAESHYSKNDNDKSLANAYVEYLDISGGMGVSTKYRLENLLEKLIPLDILPAFLGMNTKRDQGSKTMSDIYTSSEDPVPLNPVSSDPLINVSFHHL